MSNDLTDYRKSIDLLDQAILVLLAERFRVTAKVGIYKKSNSLPPVDAIREQEQIERIRSVAETTGLNPDFAEKYLRLVIDEVVKNHAALQS